MESSNTKLFHSIFLSSPKKHALMITNHGIHQWDVIPGLPDTGGQNVFVNQFTETLENFDFKITIFNRGGYKHPITGEMHSGIVYKNENARIVYLEDSTKAFVRKEDMDEQLQELSEQLFDFLITENIPIHLLISHYWDGAKLGCLANAKLENPLPHVWVPHSLGCIKKRNVKPEKWSNLRIDERIGQERAIVREVDIIADTSITVRNSLKRDYDTRSGIFLPPCVMTSRFKPETINIDNEIWSFLSNMSGSPAHEIKQFKIITEISRTDTTKRKDILIKAFARVHQKHPDTFLIVAIDDNETDLSAELKGLIKKHGLENHVAAIGNEWDRMPTIYNITDVYCSPSIMEGFGMSIQEAAAVGVPGVGSNLIPFVSEYLLGIKTTTIEYNDDKNECQTLKQGKGAFMVSPDDIAGFTLALNKLIEDDALRRTMGANAYNITIPYFTWNTMVQMFLDAVTPLFTLDDRTPPSGKPSIQMVG